MSDKTNDFVLINEVHDDLLFLKDGSVAAVIETSAVNFDLLSGNEQLAIISSFAGLLNSLSFPIQIVIRSKKLDISSYLSKLMLAEAKQTSPLLKQMMANYRNFINTIITDNEVLDKQFLVVIPVSSIELGILASASSNIEKVFASILPRIDQVTKQLSRVGLRTTVLQNEDLIKLFYEEYNEGLLDQPLKESPAPTINQAVRPGITNPAVLSAEQAIHQAPPAPPIQITTPPPVSAPVQPIMQPVANQPAQPQTQTRRSTPFVVEELKDDYGVII